jgi:hypothetical protein
LGSRTADGFRREGVLRYLPNYQKLVRVRCTRFRGRRRLVRLAIIPGLLFAPVPDADLFWLVMNRVPGFVDLLRSYTVGELILLKNDDTETIRRILSFGYGVLRRLRA